MWLYRGKYFGGEYVNREVCFHAQELLLTFAYIPVPVLFTQCIFGYIG